MKKSFRPSRPKPGPQVRSGAKPRPILLAPRLGLAALPLALPILGVFQTHAAQASPIRILTAPTRMALAMAEYVIGAEDTLSIRVRNHDDLNRTIVVRPDGRINLPRAGEVQASGRTAAQLERTLTALLARTLNNAGVEVEVTQTRVRQVRVTGAVKAPSAYKVSAGWKLADLVAAAGGLSTDPERIQGKLVRAGVVKPVDVAQAMAQPRSAANITVLPDDIVMLDESTIPNQVTVTGRVGRPGAYDLQKGLSVTNLMAQVGGPGEAASLKQAYVLRGGVPLPLDLSGLGTPMGVSPATANFKFQIGDILTVPENRAQYSVTGQVNKATFFTLPERAEDTTLLKALATAGGATADADLKNATITRNRNGAITKTTVDLDAMLRGLAPDTTMLMAGDTLFVPRRTAQVHIIGPVGKPGAYDLSDGMSLMSLISEAGIPSKSAGLDKTYIQRDGKQIPLDLRSVLVDGKINEDLAGFKLQAGDVLVLPDPQPVVTQISVIGQVPRTGAFTLDDKLSVASLIAQIGNPLPAAALSQSYVIRSGQQLPLNLYRFLVTGDATSGAANFKFQAGDVLVIPENKVRFAVLGQVGRPGYFPYPETKSDATILKALAEAGGPAGSGGDGGANLSNAGIIRTVRGQSTVIPINISEILQKGNMTSNVVLQPDDILYIPPKKRGFKWTDVLGPAVLLGGL